MLSEREELDYNQARNHVDNLISDHSDEINKYLKKIASYRAQICLGLISEWRSIYRNLINQFDDALNWATIHDNISAAYGDYIRYAFYYRFANNLENNIVFRKILSFEIHFFSKRNVFTRSTSKVSSTDFEEDAQMFYSEPLAHFIAFRIQKELLVRDLNLADLEGNLQALLNVNRLVRTKVFEFFSRYSMATNDYPKLDSFREYLDEKQNAEFKSIIIFIETKSYRNQSAF